MAVKLTAVDRRIVEKLGQARDILDVGCGDGRLTWYLAQETHRQITGLDLSDAGFKKAKKAAYQAGIRELVQCVKGDACNLDFPDAQFDGVILAHTLHHIDDPPAALKETYRVLKPGGTIIVIELEVNEGEKKGGCYQFTLLEITEALAKAGFKDICREQGEDDFLLVTAKKTAEELWTKGKSWRY